MPKGRARKFGDGSHGFRGTVYNPFRVGRVAIRRGTGKPFTLFGDAFSRSSGCPLPGVGYPFPRDGWPFSEAPRYPVASVGYPLTEARVSTPRREVCPPFARDGQPWSEGRSPRFPVIGYLFTEGRVLPFPSPGALLREDGCRLPRAGKTLSEGRVPSSEGPCGTPGPLNRYALSGCRDHVFRGKGTPLPRER